MRQRGHERQTVKPLRDARPHGLPGLVLAPVACGKLVLHASGHARCHLERLGDVGRLAPVQLPLQGLPEVLDGLAPEPRPRGRDQGPGQVDPLLAEVISVIFQVSAKVAQQQPVAHVADEVCLARLDVGRPPDVRQQLLLQQLPRILDAHVARGAHGRAALRQEVQCQLLRVDGRRVLDRVAARVQHREVAEVVDDALQDVLVRDDAEPAEHDDEGHLHAEVRAGADELAAAVRLAAHVAEELHREAGAAGGALEERGADLADPGVLRGLLLGEGVHEVVGHALQRDQHLLGAVDDEVAALVQRALAKLREDAVVGTLQPAVLRAHHDRHLHEVHLLVHLFGDQRPTLVFVDVVDLLCDVDKHACSIGGVPQPGLPGCQHPGGAVGLLLRGLVEVQLAKLPAEHSLRIYRLLWIVLAARCQL
mmetsp:Transcript_25103/g.72303  ORF Transcript_25103/g.72303 Transcript_25103/m.72303 type:complete len:422 (-) Transcript_25103:220-1485(-)